MANSKLPGAPASLLADSHGVLKKDGKRFSPPVPSSPPPSSPLPLDMPSSPAPEVILPTKEVKASTKSAALEMPTLSQFPLPAAKGPFLMPIVAACLS